MEDINKGKKMLIVVIIVTLSMDLLSTVLSAGMSYYVGNPDYAMLTLIQGAIRLLLTCLVFLLIYKGRNRARKLCVIIYGIGSVYSLLSAFFNPRAGLYMLIIAIPYGIFTFVLSSKQVKAFQHYKRTGNVEFIG